MCTGGLRHRLIVSRTKPVRQILRLPPLPFQIADVLQIGAAEHLLCRRDPIGCFFQFLLRELQRNVQLVFRFGIRIAAVPMAEISANVVAPARVIARSASFSIALPSIYGRI